MRFSILLLFISAMISCTSVQESPVLSKLSSDTSQDILLFLSTDNPKVEKEVLDRLKHNKVSHEEVKEVLRKSNRSTKPEPGFQFGLQLDHNNKKYPFALYVPDSFDPQKKYPMLVVLHGLGSSGDSIIRSWVERLAGEFIIVCPSYPMGAWWSKTAEEIVLKLIRQVRAGYSVDHNRVLLAGLSNGAIGAYLIGMFYPDYFAGILPIAGSITERYMHFLVNLINTPIYIIQGTHDPIFPVSLTRRVHKILTDMKSPVIYREHEEKGLAHGGHFLPDAEIPGMAEWLKKQRRPTNPPVIRMTREANHMGRIHWARLSKGNQLAALQLPGPEKETMNVQNGKIATLFAVNPAKNKFNIMGKNLMEYELFLNENMVDFDAPVIITTQKIQEANSQLIPSEKILSFNQKVEKDMGMLLHGFKELQDPNLLFDAKVTITFSKTVGYAYRQ